MNHVVVLHLCAAAVLAVTFVIAALRTRMSDPVERALAGASIVGSGVLATMLGVAAVTAAGRPAAGPLVAVTAAGFAWAGSRRRAQAC